LTISPINNRITPLSIAMDTGLRAKNVSIDMGKEEINILKNSKMQEKVVNQDGFNLNSRKFLFNKLFDITKIKGITVNGKYYPVQ